MIIVTLAMSVLQDRMLGMVVFPSYGCFACFTRGAKTIEGAVRSFPDPSCQNDLDKSRDENSSLSVIDMPLKAGCTFSSRCLILAGCIRRVIVSMTMKTDGLPSHCDRLCESSQTGAYISWKSRLVGWRGSE